MDRTEQIRMPGMEDIPEPAEMMDTSAGEINLSDHDCNDCKWYAPYTGLCCKKASPFYGQLRHGDEEACGRWELWGK